LNGPCNFPDFIWQQWTTAANSDGAPTCNDYRAEMILLGLRRRLQCEDLDEQQRRQLLEEIGTMEKSLGLR
jgi:lipoprotein NlpI